MKRILITIEDGSVSAVQTDDEIEVYVLNKDEEDEAHPHYEAQLGGALSRFDIEVAPETTRIAARLWQEVGR